MFFFEVKAFTPGYKVFLGDDDKIKEAIDRVAEAIKQLYTSAFEKFQVEYWFNQDNHEENVPVEKRWGLVIVNEDILVRRELIYKRAAEMHEIDLDSNEFRIMRERIAISDIDEFEKCCILGESILFKLKDRKIKGELDSIFQFDKEKTLIEYSNNKNYLIYSKILEKLNSDYKKTLLELIEIGLIKP